MERSTSEDADMSSDQNGENPFAESLRVPGPGSSAQG